MEVVRIMGLQIKTGKNCINCCHCRCKSGRAWCSKGLWIGSSGMKMATMSTVDIRGLAAKYYKDNAKQCSEYMSMEG